MGFGDSYEELLLDEIHRKLKYNREDMLAGEEPGTLDSHPALANSFSALSCIELPKPDESFTKGFAEILYGRLSRREFSERELTLEELSNLLFYSFGVKGRREVYGNPDYPERMFPSTGGLQGIDCYFVTNRVRGLERGLYYYNPLKSRVELLKRGDFNRTLQNICCEQPFIEQGALTIVLTISLKRLGWKYGLRSYRYAHIDCGAVTQNLYLVAEGLDLNCCAIAGFIDDELNTLLGLEDIKEEFATLALTIGG